MVRNLEEFKNRESAKLLYYPDSQITEHPFEILRRLAVTQIPVQEHLTLV